MEWFVAVLVTAIGSGALSAYVADAKGRSGAAWFFVGMCFPLLSLLALIAVPALPRQSVTYQPTRYAKPEEELPSLFGQPRKTMLDRAEGVFKPMREDDR